MNDFLYHERYLNHKVFKVIIKKIICISIIIDLKFYGESTKKCDYPWDLIDYLLWTITSKSYKITIIYLYKEVSENIYNTRNGKKN